jgi:glucose-6-phosphate 1-dehydrogenase
LRQHAGDVPAGVRDALVGGLRYRVVDPAEPGTVAAAVHALADDRPVAVYLALPPALFPPVLTALGEAGLPRGSRIAVEKPFGADLAGAEALNELLGQVTGGEEDAAFRVDHFLGMPAVQPLLDLHVPGGPLAAVWDSRSLAQVDVLWEETLGLEGRATFYDATGSVRDVLQNHLLQVLTLLAMEPPAGPDHEQLHAAKLALLRSVHGPSADDIGSRTRRARYTGYTDTDGVDPARGTETYAELLLEVGTPRWAGTGFTLRTGKAMGTLHKGVALTFRGEAPAVDPGHAERIAPDRLWIELDAPEQSGEPGVQLPAAPGERTAYGAVLTELFSGGSRLSVTAEEAEQAWRIVDPVLQAWARDEVPMLEYPAGSDGPPPLR